MGVAVGVLRVACCVGVVAGLGAGVLVGDGVMVLLITNSVPFGYCSLLIDSGCSLLIDVGIEVTKFGVIGGGVGVDWQAVIANDIKKITKDLDFINYRLSIACRPIISSAVSPDGGCIDPARTSRK